MKPHPSKHFKGWGECFKWSTTSGLMAVEKGVKLLKIAPFEQVMSMKETALCVCVCRRQREGMKKTSLGQYVSRKPKTYFTTFRRPPYCLTCKPSANKELLMLKKWSTVNCFTSLPLIDCRSVAETPHQTRAKAVWSEQESLTREKTQSLRW